MDNIKFKRGLAKHPLTREEAEEQELSQSRAGELPVAKDNLAITVDPSQLVRCIRYYRVNYTLMNSNNTTTCMVHKLYLAFYRKRLLT